MKRENCPDCGVKIGEFHRPGCDVERCPECGGQRIGCYTHENCKTKTKWTGYWPGELECQEYNLFSKFIHGSGWESCEANDPDGGPDLNTLISKGTWSKQKQKFIMPMEKNDKLN